ncbi:MAG TPA: HNH endonuclease [Xanthobacteraceae bacterium]|jgi:putative restriction endonuclease
MSKVVFTTKNLSSYDDRPEEYYHFPSTYLNQARSAIGDYVIYYEPRRLSTADSSRGGRQAYFATARLDEIVEDRKLPHHFYAIVSDFLSFDRPVPFSEGGHYYESGLQKSDGSTNKGAFGRAVRQIPEADFDQILKAGFAVELAQLEKDHDRSSGAFDEPVRIFERPIVEMTVSRKFRDRAFKTAVRVAYDNRCALTGLCLINGGGRPEVQAAHIMPVADNGPDSVRNGLALSGTFHWLFDRGLVSIDEDHRILVAKNGIPDQISNLLNASGKIVTPNDRNYWPHPYYLRHHREHTFKG